MRHAGRGFRFALAHISARQTEARPAGAQPHPCGLAAL